MSVSLYMNHHVPVAVTAGLRQRGVDVVTAYEDGFAELDDERLLERTVELDRVLYTHDHHFLVITRRWLHAGRSFSGLVFARQLGVTIGKAIEDLELIAKASDPGDTRGQVVYLPL